MKLTFRTHHFHNTGCHNFLPINSTTRLNHLYYEASYNIVNVRRNNVISLPICYDCLYVKYKRTAYRLSAIEVINACLSVL